MCECLLFMIGISITVRLINNANPLRSSHVPDGETHPVMNDLLPPGPLNEIYFGYNNKWW
jgi:adenine specific DNA methylase Mod